ncbi:MAG: acyl carrier protein [Deltaproteobacteria bacterium]|nr:acyl carrier protein [Deltaproteobacteria bacterium]
MRPAARESSSAEIQEWITAMLASWIEVPQAQLDVRRPVVELGIDSIVILSLVGELEEWLGRPIPDDILEEHPTIESIARYLSDAAKSQ